MPAFRYRIARQPAHAEAVIDAPNRAAAIRALIERGETPVRVEPVESTGTILARRAPAARRAGALSRTQFRFFISELATAINAGLPLVQALRTIAKQGKSPPRQALLERLIDAVEHGASLSEALRKERDSVDDLVVSLVAAGEQAGRLGEVLTQAARLLERDAKLRASLLGAMLYPAIIAAAVGLAVLIVVTVIVPRVLGAVAGQLPVLPMPTRIVQGVASFTASYWWAILLAAVAALWWIRSLLQAPASRIRIDRALLRTPIVGPALRDVAVARFTRTLATLISAGLPVIASLRVTRDVLGNRALAHAIDHVCEAVSAGRTIAEPLERSGWFPPLLVQIVGLGEQTGRLDEMLDQAATAFEDKTEQSIKTLTTVLPPILIITLACVVGFIVLAILLPLIELQESIG